MMFELAGVIILVHSAVTLGGPANLVGAVSPPSPCGNGATHPSTMGHALKAHRMDGCTPSELQPASRGLCVLVPSPRRGGGGAPTELAGG